MHICVQVCLVDSDGRLETKTLCGTLLDWHGIKTKDRRVNGKVKRRVNRMAKERRGGVYCLSGEGVSDCLFCGPTACVWAVSYQNVRRTFPIGSLLSAVCVNVKAIREIGGVKETSQSHLKE